MYIYTEFLTWRAFSGKLPRSTFASQLMWRTFYRILCSFKVVLEAIFCNFSWNSSLCFKKYISPTLSNYHQWKAMLCSFWQYIFLEKNLKYSKNLTLWAWPTSCHITFLKKTISLNIFLQSLAVRQILQKREYFTLENVIYLVSDFYDVTSRILKTDMTRCQRTVRTYVYVISSEFHAFPINQHKGVEFSINPL